MSSGGSSGGGGGGSGKIDWPDYFKKMHEGMWRKGVHFYDETDDYYDTEVSISQALWEAWDNSPYAPAFAFDPTADLEDVDNEYVALDGLITNFVPEDTYEANIDKALEVIDGKVLDDTSVQNAVDAYEQRKEGTHLRNMGRFAAGMADLNAIATSSYVMGMANLEMDFANDVSAFGKGLAAENYKIRNQMIVQAEESMHRMLTEKVQMQHNYNAGLAEFKRVKILANREYIDRDLELAVKDHLWNLEIWQFGSNLLASASGGTANTTAQNQGSNQGGGLTSMLGGAMGGAGTGAAIATAAGLASNPAGWVIGAGALLGGAMGGM